jgi:lysylphosphatidylglycerol synthetase-like protein (DUF2156 family)
MRETIAVILIILWLLGLVSSYTMGGFIHVLMVIAIVVVVLRDSRSPDLAATGGNMGGVKIAALLLMVAGALALAFGGFSYTKETHEAKLGPIELTVKDRETVNVPVWAGVGMILIGGVLLAVGSKKG